MAPYIDTPRTDARDRTIANMDFSEMPSFHAPAGADDLLNAMKTAPNATRKTHTFATPSARTGGRRAPVTKPEFTPLLHSAVRNRQSRQMLGGELETPAALKAGYRFSSPALPEASMMGGDSMVSDTDETPIPIPNSSSSAMGTPLPQMPRKGDLGLNGDGGNVLTLKEQEEKLEKIDKENFGLKLKIHFLEENLKRTGTEFSQQTIRENTELKTTQHVLEREVKRYRKQLSLAEEDLNQYKIQLAEYMEKVKRRHMDEAMRDQLDKMQTLVETREKELRVMQEKLEEAQKTSPNSADEVQRLREQIEELEADLKESQHHLDQREEQIEDLEAKLRTAGGAQDAELDQKDEQIEAQAEEIEELKQEISILKTEREKSSHLQDALDAAKREHAAELDDLKTKADAAERAKREQLREFEGRLLSFTREKNAELEAIQQRLSSTEESKNSEIESLEARLKIAESQGDNQSRLAQQAAEDANNKLRMTTLEKQEEIERLLSELDDANGVRDEVDIIKRQHEDAQDEIERLEKELAKERDNTALLRKDLNLKDQETRTLRNTVQDRDATMSQVDRLQLVLEERTSRIAALQKTIDTQEASLMDLKDARSKLALIERQQHTTAQELSETQREIKDRDRQIGALRQTLKDRTAELEVLRSANDEPDSQLEGLQSIVRHRDHDLEDLRTKVNQQQANLDAVQRTADERLKSLTNLRAELSDTKQDLEDEIQVLETSLDEAEERIANLVKESQAAKDGQSKVEQLTRKMRLCEQEKERLEANIQELQNDQDIADSERISLNATIDKLRAELRRAENAKRTLDDFSPLPKGTSTELKQSRIEIRDLKTRLSDVESTLRNTDLQHRESLDSKTRHFNQQLKSLERELRAKTDELLDMESEAHKHIQAGSKAQKAREEAGRLSSQMASLEKKHVGEVKGLVKQITVLRSRLGREKVFRDDLAFQKRWFLMMVDMYDACNATQIKMLEEMRISPDHAIRAKRPTLRTAALSVMFCLRAQKAARDWAESSKMQQALVRKMEAIRGVGKRVIGGR